MDKAFIYGAGGLAKLLIASMRLSGRYEPEGIVVDREFKDAEEYYGLRVIDFDEFLAETNAGECNVFISVGYRRMRARKEIFDKVRSAGYRCPNYVFGGATINQEVKTGEGNIFCDGVLIESFTSIADNNFFRSNTYVSHDCVIGSHNYIAPGCTFSGNCTLKDLCFIGVGSTVIDGLTIERETFLSAGSTLLEDTEPHSQYIGYPARKIRSHEETGIIVER
ncbi:MAG: NeuD/PglB/VioB family sugar acetyltransferase [Acidobacteriota bacterium]|nr:MAG: NeuD/PglB/VioB family sugar acetyltransferase [Acidobacteriota bacterium]